MLHKMWPLLSQYCRLSGVILIWPLLYGSVQVGPSDSWGDSQVSISQCLVSPQCKSMELFFPGTEEGSLHPPFVLPIQWHPHLSLRGANNKPGSSPRGQTPDEAGRSSVSDLANSLTSDMLMVRVCYCFLSQFQFNPCLHLCRRFFFIV